MFCRMFAMQAGTVPIALNEAIGFAIKGFTSPLSFFRPWDDGQSLFAPTWVRQSGRHCASPATRTQARPGPKL